MTEERTDYDSPWKEIIEDFFPQFLEFFFLEAYKVIDWKRPYEFLDKELQQLEPDAEIGKRLVDKVAKVWLHNGEQAWVLVHVEVQGQYDSQFTQRMYTYNYRLFDRHQKRVISLAVLADEEANWRPASYSYQLGGCCVSLKFPVAKILDYDSVACPSDISHWETLEQNPNPFSVVVMAHLKAKATNRDPENRLQWKLKLVRGLLERGYKRKEIIGLFRFIDWIMVLPKELANSFKTELRSYEGANKMRYVTSVERLAKEEGIEQGIERGTLQTSRDYVIELLEARFGEVPSLIVDSVNKIDNASVLKTLFKTVINISSLEDFQQVLENYMSEK